MIKCPSCKNGSLKPNKKRTNWAKRQLGMARNLHGDCHPQSMCALALVGLFFVYCIANFDCNVKNGKGPKFRESFWIPHTQGLTHNLTQNRKNADGASGVNGGEKNMFLDTIVSESA